MNANPTIGIYLPTKNRLELLKIPIIRYCNQADLGIYLSIIFSPNNSPPVRI